MATLLFGDCLTVMKTLPDKSVDCFMCDLPFGCLTENSADPGRRSRHGYSNASWDVKIDLNQFWSEVNRLMRNPRVPIIMFCTTRFGIDLILSKPKWFRYDLVWDKCSGVSFLDANRKPLRSHEMIYIFGKTGAEYKRIDVLTDRGPVAPRGEIKEVQPYGAPGWRCKLRSTRQDLLGRPDGFRCPLSVVKIKGCRGRSCFHPTTKPQELYKWLLERYCPEGGTMLDPTAGSFNSVLTARRMGIKAIGIEMDPGFYYKGLVRLLKEKQAEQNAEDTIQHV